MIDLEQASPVVKDLAAAMSAVSQDLFQAEWHVGCELPIWQAMTDEHSPWRRRANPDLVRTLSAAWWKVLGWVVWDENLERRIWLTVEEWNRMRAELEAE